MAFAISLASLLAMASTAANAQGNADFYGQGSQASCVVSPATFTGWLAGSGSDASFSVPDNAAFKPDSANPLCSFYQQMSHNFLWLVSPESGFPYVFLGSQFYNVALDANFNPIFTPNEPSAAQGVMKRGMLKVRDAKPVQMPNDAMGAAINTGSADGINSTGQAGGGGALLSQNAQLVYYSIHVNDVYRDLWLNQATVPYFQTLQNFPETIANVQEIAAASGVPSYADGKALILELKTSWVDVSAVPGGTQGDALTLTAEVPSFVEQACPAGMGTGNCLVWDGTTYLTKILAMVGMHVVIPVPNHPELIWATFEHVFNAPDNTYSFVGPGDLLLTNSYSASDPASTFYATGTAIADANIERMQVNSKSDGKVISPDEGQTIGPSSVVRYQPWGGIQPENPSVTDPTVINNTRLLSLNGTLLPQVLALNGGEPRSAYIQTGAVWTDGGQGNIPTAAPTTPPAPGQPALIGSPVLANTTMETFHQATNPSNTQAGCFGCHFANPAAQGQSVQGVGVSHIFSVTTN